MGSFRAPEAGTYGYSFRFSGDGGSTFTYTDTSDNGVFSVADLGILTVED
jgi:hypothetical protein